MGLQVAGEAITRQGWLDPPGRRLQAAVTRAFEAAGSTGYVVKDILHGTWLGHPLHPALTDVPVGAWTASLVLDGLESMSGRRELAAAADAALAVGLVGAVGAAITGGTDWQHAEGPSRRVGLVHGALNVAAVACYTTSWLLRRRRRRGGGRGLASLGYAATLASAYLGGSMVYQLRMGTNHAEGRPAPLDFVPVLADADLPEGTPRRVEVEGAGVLLVRQDGRVRAIADTCAHYGASLAGGRIEGNAVVCPWHGSRYSLEDGRVLRGPSTYPQPCFETRVREGRIELRRPRRELAPTSDS